jgi:hypothetical protein
MAGCVPAHLWGKSLDYLFYDEVERLACTSKYFRLQVFCTASRINFRTLDSVLREVSHVQHFRQCFVREIFIANFFSLGAEYHTERTGLASFALGGNDEDGARALCSLCAYQHVLASGMPEIVILGHSWNYKVEENEETGLNALFPTDDGEPVVDGSNIPSLRLIPVDWCDAYYPEKYMPECVKYQQFIIQLTAAYESSLLSRNVVIEGIPFWHGGHSSRFRVSLCPCRYCTGVHSFFPVVQKAGNCERANPGFFPYGFNKHDEDSESE